MNDLSQALRSLWPTLNFADTNGTLAGVRYDAPLPEGFVPPTQAEVGATLTRLDVPEQVSAGQLLLELNARNLLGAVDQIVAKTDAFTQRMWARAAFIPRNDPMVLGVLAALKLSEAEADDLFRSAAAR